jgi:hypothetical protein
MQNRMIALLTVLAVGGLMLVGSAAAQQTSTTQTTTTTQAPAPPTQNAGPGQSEAGHSWENHVNQREQNQQNRIANGIDNGNYRRARQPTWRTVKARFKAVKQRTRRHITDI